MDNAVDISLDVILAKLRELEPAIKAEGVTRLAIFGSRVRGDARPDSDLDVLIETIDRGEGTLRFNVFKVMNLIEDTIGIWPHVISPTEVTSRIKERMADDLIEIF